MTQQLWRRYTEWPLLLAAVMFLAAYSVQVIGNVREQDAAWIETVVWVTCVLFVVDYIANLALAPLRGRWFIRNLHELVVLALPILRPLRLLRLVTLLKVVHRAAEVPSGGASLPMFGALPCYLHMRARSLSLTLRKTLRAQT
jgi:voltage-gated potassium channel